MDWGRYYAGLVDWLCCERGCCLTKDGLLQQEKSGEKKEQSSEAECDAMGGHTKLLGMVSVCCEERPAASGLLILRR